MPINPEVHPETNPDFSNVADLLPEGATAFQSWRIVKYFDKEGVERFQWTCEGTPQISDTVGILGTVSFDALRRTFIGDEDEDEDED